MGLERSQDTKSIEQNNLYFYKLEWEIEKHTEYVCVYTHHLYHLIRT
jgi:hypothetical protein